MNEIAELAHVPAEELRFYRLIEERGTHNGLEFITLACGHMAIAVHIDGDYAKCAECERLAGVCQK